MRKVAGEGGHFRLRFTQIWMDRKSEGDRIRMLTEAKVSTTLGLGVSLFSFSMHLCTFYPSPPLPGDMKKGFLEEMFVLLCVTCTYEHYQAML